MSIGKVFSIGVVLSVVLFWSVESWPQSSGGQGSTSSIAKQASDSVGAVVAGTIVGTLGALFEGTLIYYNTRGLVVKQYDLVLPLIGTILGAVGVGFSSLYLGIEKEPSYAAGGVVLAINAVLLIISSVHLGFWHQMERQLQKSKKNPPVPVPLPPPPSQTSSQVLHFHFD